LDGFETNGAWMSRWKLGLMVSNWILTYKWTIKAPFESICFINFPSIVQEANEIFTKLMFKGILMNMWFVQSFPIINPEHIGDIFFQAMMS